MFLIDELNQVYKEVDGQGVDRDSVKQIFQCLMKRLDTSTDENFTNSVKSINFTYKQFCESHPLMKPDGFENIVKGWVMGSIKLDSEHYKMRVDFLKRLGVK